MLHEILFLLIDWRSHLGKKKTLWGWVSVASFHNCLEVWRNCRTIYFRLLFATLHYSICMCAIKNRPGEDHSRPWEYLTDWLFVLFCFFLFTESLTWMKNIVSKEKLSNLLVYFEILKLLENKGIKNNLFLSKCLDIQLLVYLERC